MAHPCPKSPLEQRASVLECASPLALWHGLSVSESARGLALQNLADALNPFFFTGA